MIPHKHNRKPRRPRMVSIRSKQPRGAMASKPGAIGRKPRVVGEYTKFEEVHG